MPKCVLSDGPEERLNTANMQTTTTTVIIVGEMLLNFIATRMRELNFSHAMASIRCSLSSPPANQKRE
jgi:hypothetical protein